MVKRSNFYPNLEFIPDQMPQDFRKSFGRGSCGDCGMYSHRGGGFCGIYRTRGVKDTYFCNKWRPRHFKR